MPLTDAAVRNAKPGAKPVSINRAKTSQEFRDCPL